VRGGIAHQLCPDHRAPSCSCRCGGKCDKRGVPIVAPRATGSVYRASKRAPGYDLGPKVLESGPNTRMIQCKLTCCTVGLCKCTEECCWNQAGNKSCKRRQFFLLDTQLWKFVDFVNHELWKPDLMNERKVRPRKYKHATDSVQYQEERKLVAVLLKHCVFDREYCMKSRFNETSKRRFEYEYWQVLSMYADHHMC
jgi:hypothetical protein